MSESEVIATDSADGGETDGDPGGDTGAKREDRGAASAPWTARRILYELASPERRRRILESFFRHEEPQVRQQVVGRLADALRCRPQALSKMKLDQKVKFLASRISDPSLTFAFERALMLFHVQEEVELLTAVLDTWQIPHEAGMITAEEADPPSREQVEATVAALADDFDRETFAVYLATAGLLMGPKWAESTWPVADRLAIAD